MPRGLGRRAAFLAAGTVWVLTAVTAVPARASVPVLVITGRGYGHGVGLAQDGAYWMGRTGARLNQILGQFYPGTSWGRGGGAVRVVVETPSSRDTVIAFPNGGEVSDAPDHASQPGFPITVAPGGSAHLWFDGARYHAQALGRAAATSAAPAAATAPHTVGFGAGMEAPAAPVSPPTLPPPTLPAPSQPSPTTTTTAPPPSQPPATPGPPPSPPASGPGASPAADSTAPLWTLPASGGTSAVTATGRRYRGVLEFTAVGGPLRVVNQLDVEDYLRGMGEVLDPNWPGASLQAQAVASRTYALRAMQSGGELCDDDHCQVYLGQQVEHPAMDRAVAATRGLVLVFNHALADTVFSANGGAVSASPLEGFGPAAPATLPYLRSAPYPTQDPSPWSVQIGLSDLAARLSYPGTVSGATVTQTGPSGRALAIVLDGTRGAMAVDPHRFAAELGLRSTLFTLAVQAADSAPPPPAAADLIQVPPDEAARPAGAAVDAAPATALPPVLAPVRSLAAAGRPGRDAGTMPAGAAATLLLLGVAAAAVLKWRRA